MTRVNVTFGRVGGVLVLALIRAWRLLPETEMRTLTLAGEDMAWEGVLVVLEYTTRGLQAHTSPVSRLTFLEGFVTQTLEIQI